MREVLFRGKRNNGEWVKGGIVHQTNFYGDPWDAWFIIDGTDTPKDFDIGPDYRVDPDTVGEYTGLTDRTGKRVFEGDILGWTARYGLLRGIVRFGRYQNPVNDGGYSIGWHIEWIEGNEPHTRKELAYWIENGLRVCGNVHENFDLLKPTY